MNRLDMKRLATAVVLAALVAALSGCGLLKGPNEYLLPGAVARGGAGYEVQAHFDNVENLVPNSRVMYNNVIIGTVAKIERDGWRAKVTLLLNKDVPLSKDVRFTIGQQSLLGSEYVQVDEPHTDAAGEVVRASRLTPGSDVAVSQTGGYPETEDVLASLSLVLNGGGLSQLQTITSELAQMVGSPSQQRSTRELIGTADKFVASLDQNKQNILRLLRGLNRLAATLAKERDTVTRAIDHLGPGLSALADERRQLVTALKALDRFGVTGTRVIQSSGDELVTNLQQLQPVLTKLDEAGSSVAEALNVVGTFPFPLPTTPIAVRGDFANFFPTVDLSLPQLTANFVGGQGDISGNTKDGTAFQVFDPITGPLGIGDLSTGADPGTTAPAPVGGPVSNQAPSPSPSPTTTPTPTPKPCNLVTALLGGC